MNFKQLSYFQDIVRTGSFTEAAEENFISQSVMSQQMKSLEEELGVILFERKNRGFHLTRAGKFFYQKSLVTSYLRISFLHKKIPGSYHS